MNETRVVTLEVNGQQRQATVRPEHTLLEVLREQLYLTGAKRGCNQGVCGACTVLRDGVPVRACLSLAVNSTGYGYTTVEGLAPDGRLHALQTAFVAKGAPQCGFCMPGMVLAAKALLDANPHPSLEEIRDSISGNLCRCTGYVRVIDAIRAVAEAGAS
jgi:aerobic carbon-monoxide dehydrogenase small subunit